MKIFSLAPLFCSRDFSETRGKGPSLKGVRAHGQLDLQHNKVVTQSVGGSGLVNFIYDLPESSDSSRFLSGASGRTCS